MVGIEIVCRWLNGWLMQNRRDGDIKEKVGPFFTLLYRAMEKLPLITVKNAKRSIRVNNIPSLLEIY